MNKTAKKNVKDVLNNFSDFILSIEDEHIQREFFNKIDNLIDELWNNEMFGTDNRIDPRCVIITTLSKKKRDCKKF